MTIRLMILASILLLAASCKTNKELTKSPEDIKKVKVNDEDIVFQLKKSPCYGTCPMYDFRIYKNQFAQFIGAKHTDKLGTFGRFISKDSYNELVEKFEAAQFSQFEDFYESNIADLPTIRVSFTEDGQKKTVTGKRERPEALHKLQFLLERIAENPEGWVKISDETGIEKEVKVDKSRIIIEIARGNQLAKWFDQMKDKFGMQIIERLNNDSTSWLVSYNGKHNPDEVLKYLKADPVLKSAAFNLMK